MINKYKMLAVALVLLAVYSKLAAQTTDSQKLSYILFGNAYNVSNGYQPNGVHAGVDFNGLGDGTTPVKAPVSGTVVANTTSCGKVAIFDGINTVIMAHMTALTSAPVGSAIAGGDYVGKVSQVAGGGCTVTGPHLHIEVRNGNNPTMALPTANNTATTKDPLSYFNYNSWDFTSNNNFLGWTIYNIDAASVNNGNLFMDPWDHPNDPYLFSPYISLSASTYPYVKLRMASNAVDGNGTIYFKTLAENSYSEDKKIAFTVNNCSLCGNAPFYNYSINGASHPKWTGIITGIRLDPAVAGKGGTNADSIGIDYINLSTTP